MSNTFPDWLIVGAPKCGTTTVAAWINSHPQGFVSATKELRFFDDHWDRGLGWYAEQFDHREPGQLAGEGTPVYMYSDLVLDRIAATIPDVRIIVLLREPVSRMWSQSWFLRTLGVDPRPLSRAIATERRTGKSGFGLQHGYLETSHYAARVRAVQERFSGDQVLVEFNETMSSDPELFWNRICAHIGLEPSISPPDFRSNVFPGRKPKSAYLQWGTTVAFRRGVPRRPLDQIRKWNAGGRPYPKMPAELHAELRTEFAVELPELEQLLDRRLPDNWYPA